LTNLSHIYADVIQAELLKIDFENKLLICYRKDCDQKECIVRYDIDPENKIFTSSVEQFWEGAKLNLINSIYDNNGMLIPTYIVLEADYLIDASAIAECFQNYLISPLHFFRNRFEITENRSYLLLGNLANFFLDEIVFAKDQEEVAFDNIFQKSFKQSPFEYTSCEDINGDNDFREFMNKARQLFENIKRVVYNDFPKLDIDVNYCTLEPTFFSVKYGFQGRLDLLYTSPGNTDAKIIELKSGRLPYPSIDSTKVALNHNVQTYVYRLMIDSVFGSNKYDVDASILYAAANIPGENIRNAMLDGDLEKQILNLRNHIVINEHNIITGNTCSVESLFTLMFQQVSAEKRLPKFFQNNVNNFKSVLSNCTEIERTYFFRYTQFISRELYHQKIGDVDYETPTGMASLWNSSFDERADALDIIYNLSIQEINDSENDMTIVFNRNQILNEKRNELVNFREGEICIVYPRRNENDSVLNKQILKGTIVHVTLKKVIVRFRYKQKNHHYFENNPLWAIEHDSLDSSYNSMYKSLFSFISSPKYKRDLLLGLRPPGLGNPTYKNGVSKLIINNNDPQDEVIIKQAINAEEYFLIVGPPGTGKTSIYVKRLIEEYYKMPDINLIVIAYTNRAVDELCDAINAAFGYSNGECEKYIRVGSELSCSPEHCHRLLKNVSERSTNRLSLRKEIIDTRIFVSTLASITGKMELFKLKKFQVSIIDEASQILEPQIIGLLPNLDKFILIGDHNQLSTIVLQEEYNSKINYPDLQNIGIYNCRESFFERLLRRSHSEGWDYVYTQLAYQGRMHNEIALFPSIHFYSDNLFPALEWQMSDWNLKFDPNKKYDRYIATERTAFFSTKILQNNSTSNKINENEADIIIDILKSISRVYQHNNLAFDCSKIGIIAPYRNQIALIRNKLIQSDIQDTEKIMIDTVERYQGSQRDIIIVSFCINQYQQIKYLCNLSYDKTVDRKLNVALTRARQQLFLVGNTQILNQHHIYASLVDFYSNKLIKVE